MADAVRARIFSASTPGGAPGGLARWSRGLVTTLLLCAIAAAHCESPVREQRVTTPREFGYSLGDTVTHALHFELASGYRLDLDALPERGRLTRWLALLEVSVQRGLPLGARAHVITLVYQVVNEPTAVLGVGTPPQSFRVVGPEDDFPVILPAWGFTIAPITLPDGRPAGALPQLRPPLPPPARNTGPRLARIALVAIAALALAAALAYVHLVVPFLSRTTGPFALACRRLERLSHTGISRAVYAAALGEAHRAFNTTAGRVVFEHELERFFVEHPQFAPLRGAIGEMFADSSREFFHAGPAPALDARQLGALLELCRACRDRERGLP